MALPEDSRSRNADYGSIRLSNRLFEELTVFIRDQVGIKITPVKKVMLEGRLQKRLRKLGMRSFDEYCKYLFSDEGRGGELTSMIDEVTTNKTDFFREPAHFNYLTSRVLPTLLRGGGFTVSNRLTIWSAGCSSGEEPYTIAMVVQDFADTAGAERLPFHVVATDISRRVLEKGQKAVYEDDKVAPIPVAIKKKFLLKSRNPEAGLFRIAPEIRSRVSFRRLNFMDGDFGFREKIDIIFCRNVIIYFDKIVQERLLNKFCRCLKPDGYIFMGHSETLFGMDLPLEQVAPTVYRKTGTIATIRKTA
ncbi:MAG TPA: CheR family methyltransferase [Syntrophorhabdaceae bacterium]|nr:methyltransferase domain-containing protein [Syntrophorhabdus sp.]HNT43126.1 CheR family methyltransferase [Syntrophorhabdaceae bacterium]